MGNIDDVSEETYSLPVVRMSIFKIVAGLSVWIGMSFSVSSEDLDAALAAQKKRAERRIYSESAQIDDQSLEVPRAPTREEQELDRKLREMDAKADSLSAAPAVAMPSRPVVIRSRPIENKNWLTPEALENSVDTAPTNQIEEESWLIQELDRQKDLKTQEALQKEAAEVEKLLREKPSPKNSLPPLDRLKAYQPALPSFLGNTDEDEDTPAYMTPKSRTPDPLATIRPVSKKEQPVRPPLFSPEAARLSAPLNKGSLQPARSSWVPPTSGAPWRNSSSGFSSVRAQPSPVSPSPLQMIKESSPMNRPNPFADDHPAASKRSIWD